MTRRSAPSRERPTYLNHVRCPECGVPMAERTRTRTTNDGEPMGSKFYGCARFPLCIGTRPMGPGLDSYSKLLQTAYTKALVFLCSPKFFGTNAAQVWLLSKALDKEEHDPAIQDCAPEDLDNESLERGIEAANAYVFEHEVDHDFLLSAHEERMLALRSRLKFSTRPETMRNMPKALIQRRYDTGTMEQFEATITTDWVNDGHHCPRCGRWAQTIVVPVENKGSQGGFSWDVDFNFDDKPSVLKGTWSCIECGDFSRIDDVYTYKNDALDPLAVPGATFQNRRRKR
jgi:hypothetical protein